MVVEPDEIIASVTTPQAEEEPVETEGETEEAGEAGQGTQQEENKE